MVLALHPGGCHRLFAVAVRPRPAKILFVKLRAAHLAAKTDRSAAARATAVIVFYALLAAVGAFVRFAFTSSRPSLSALDGADFGLFFVYITLNLVAGFDVVEFLAAYAAVDTAGAVYLARSPPIVGRSLPRRLSLCRIGSARPNPRRHADGAQSGTGATKAHTRPKRTAIAASHTRPASASAQNTADEPQSLIRPMSRCRSGVT